MRRTKQVVQQFKSQATPQQGLFTLDRIPKYIIIPKFGRSLRVPIILPEYKPKSFFTSKQNTCHPFVEITPEYVPWLQQYSDTILLSEPNREQPLFNGKLDYTNPAISGFRLYLSPLEFTHIQVIQNPKYRTIFQLNYYESDYPKNPKLLMIIIVDITESDIESIDLVYASSKLEIIEDGLSRAESNLEYARRFGTLFRHILVYMRIWDYSLNENHCMVLPYPSIKENKYEVHYPADLPED